VLAARIAATRILQGLAGEIGDSGRATLFLTAALLQCAIRDGEGVTRPALVAHLNDLARSGLPGAGMRASRMQFCRYAAAEIDTLTPMQRCDLIRTLLTAMATPGPAEELRENCGSNDKEVRI
jgi:hypothetical protein